MDQALSFFPFFFPSDDKIPPFFLLEAFLASSGLQLTYSERQLHRIVCACGKQSLPARHYSTFIFSMTPRTELVISVMLMRSLVTWKRNVERDTHTQVVAHQADVTGGKAEE